MKRTLSYLIMLGGAIAAPLQLTYAQDSLLWKDFQYLKQSDPWLTSPNAAGLTRLNTNHLSEAQIGYGFETGGFVNYYEAAKSRTINAGIESFYRLSPSIVMYGRMGYDNFEGKAMTGSAFIDHTHNPFDIVESTLENSGRKHKDTYTLTGGVSGSVYKDIAIGAKVDYTAANYAKYKDLRHKNNLMDLAFTAGVYVPVGKHVQIGANYYYRRSTDDVRFSLYGSADIVYKSIIDYGASFGKTEAFGGYGYTDQNREMPLFNKRQGAGLQIGWDITPNLSWYNNFAYFSRDGYYGKKSTYTISYNQWDGDAFGYDGRITLKQGRNKHALDMKVTVEKTNDYSNSYREVENKANSARYYEYYTPVKLSKKTWTEGGLAYTGYYGINDLSAVWTVNGGVNFAERNISAYEYPYYRKQDLTTVEFFARGERNIALRKGLLTADLGLSYKKGSGDMYKDGILATPSDKQSAPSEMTAFLHREYQYLTAPQYSIDAAVKYSFIFPHTSMKTFAQLSAKHLQTTKHDDYLDGRNHTTLSITIGCTF